MKKSLQNCVFFFSELNRILKPYLPRFLIYKRIQMYIFSNTILICEVVKLCSQSVKFTVTHVLEYYVKIFFKICTLG